MQIVACLVTVLAFRAAVEVPGVAARQAVAACATRFLLRRRGSMLAALSYRFFEEPILRYEDRLGRLTRPEN